MSIEVCEGPVKEPQKRGRPQMYPWKSLYIETMDDGEVKSNYFFVPRKELSTLYHAARAAELKLSLPDGVKIQCTKAMVDGVWGVQVGLVYGKRQKRRVS